MPDVVKQDRINYEFIKSYAVDGTPILETKALTVGQLLGYDTSSLALGILLGVESPVGSVMKQIADIQRLCAEARVDGMATQVGDLAVDFNTHIGRLKTEGSQQVRVLSGMTGIAIKVDIFTGQSPSSRNTTYQVRSTPFI